MTFGQLASWGSLREVVDLISSIKTKSYGHGFVSKPIKLSSLAYANEEPGLQDV